MRTTESNAHREKFVTKTQVTQQVHSNKKPKSSKELSNFLIKLSKARKQNENDADELGNYAIGFDVPGNVAKTSVLNVTAFTCKTTTTQTRMRPLAAAQLKLSKL